MQGGAWANAPQAMDTSAIQIEIAPLPAAANVAKTASPADGETAFKNVLDRAMDNGNAGNPLEPSATGKDKRPGRTKSPGTDSEKPLKLAIPAVLIAAASANLMMAGGQASGRPSVSGSIASLSWLSQMMPDQGAVAGSQAGAAGADSAKSDGNRRTPSGTNSSAAGGSTSAEAEANLGTNALLEVNGHAESPLAQGTSLLPDTEMHLIGNTQTQGNKASEPPATSGSSVPAAESQGFSPSGSIADAVQRSNEKTQQAFAALEDLKLGFLSTGTTPASGDTKVNGAPLSPLAAGRASASTVEASNLVHSKPEAGTAPHNPAKDAAGSNATTQTGQNGSNSGPATGGGGSADDSKSDSKSNPAARQSNNSGGSGSGNSSTAASFASTLGSAATTSTSAAPVAVAQATPANGLPAGSTAPAQPQASHVAGNSMTAAADNPFGATGAVSSASLLQAQGRTAMHVSLQTESLGPLELHAILDGGKVGASIAVVNHEAHTVLTNELPALQQVLSEQNLRVEHLSVLSAPMNSGTGTGRDGGFQGFSQPRDNPGSWYSGAPPQTAAPSSEYLTPEALRGRLSVRA
ncbi:MAG: flagellar hook-length control protein FliK [Terriglobia bacterium]